MASSPDYLCARCAALRGGCCTHREIYLTPGDRRRMAAHLGRDDFWGRRPAGHPDYLPDGTDPHWERYVFDSRMERPILLSVTHGLCGLLGPGGCVLPMEVRPLICRLYPWEYGHRGLVALAGDCPRDFLAPGETLLGQLGMEDLHRVRTWHRMLYAEMREETDAAPRAGLAGNAPDRDGGSDRGNPSGSEADKGMDHVMLRAVD